MSVRITALSVPFFYDGGIEVGAGWSEMPVDLTSEQRAVLLAHVGSLVQIHPEDVEGLAEYGLELVGGKLSEVTEGAEGTESDLEPKAKRTNKRNKGASGAGKE